MIFKAPWIEITTCLPCKNRCPYCPQDKLMSVYKGEKILTFKRFIQILKNIPKDVIITFSGFGEPFQSPECADMMVYANEQGYKIAVWSTLVGLTDEEARKIEDIPFINFNVHDIGQEKKDYEFITEWHKAVPNSRGGNLYKQKRREIIKGCARGNNFNCNVMLPNGDVYLCCSDWGLQHKLGNLLETNFDDLKREKEYELCHYCTYAL